MTTTSITNARKDLFQLADTCIRYNNVVNINTKTGNVIMLSEDDYRSMLETLNLCSIPGMKESIVEGLNTPLSECVKIEWK